MDSEVFFQEYTISEETVARLESIRKALKDNIIRANPMWKLLAGEVRTACVFNISRSLFTIDFDLCISCKVYLIFKLTSLFYYKV